MSTITRLQFQVWKAHTRIKGRWKILYVFVPSVTTLKCPISSQATKDVFYFHFSFSQGHRYSSAGPEAILEALFGLTLCQVGEGYYRANVNSSGNELSRGAELRPHRTKSRGWIMVLGYSYWWLHSTDPRSDTLGCSLTSGFIAYSLCSFAPLTRPWQYSEVTAWPNIQLIKYLRALEIRKMKIWPS